MPITEGGCLCGRVRRGVPRVLALAEHFDHERVLAYERFAAGSAVRSAGAPSLKRRSERAAALRPGGSRLLREDRRQEITSCRICRCGNGFSRCRSACAKSLSEEEQKRIYADYAELSQAPGVTTGLPLGLPKDAKTVRVRDDGTQASDGPYMDAMGAIGGYFVLEAEDVDAAIKFASRIPAARLGGTSGEAMSELVQKLEEARAQFLKPTRLAEFRQRMPHHETCASRALKNA
jgi:hypothetical protein